MKLLLLAGEESGQLYARQIAERVRARFPDVEIRGYGDYGFATGDLAVMGIVPVLLHIFFFLRVRKTLAHAIDAWRPDVVCTVDYPGMNLRLAAYAKSRGIRTVHVVCPQVWAWKRGRIPKIEASVERLCCFFPFEPKIFRPGFATFVGHPLAQTFASEKPAVRGASGERILALLPGSRVTEVTRILPPLLEAGRRLKEKFPDLTLAIPAANPRARQAIERCLATAGMAPEASPEILSGGARDLLRRAEAAVVASGTATLEAALARCPTVLVYRVDPLFAAIARRVIKGVRHIGLANILWEKSELSAAPGSEAPMPELLQENFTSEAVVRQVDPWLADRSARDAAVARLDAATALLDARGDAMGRIADLILEKNDAVLCGKGGSV